MKNILLLLLISICSVQSFADNFSDSNKLFDWAELNYPEYFSPSGQKTFDINGYLARYYSNTDIYVGTIGKEVYVHGDVFNGLLKVGQMSDFIELTEPVISYGVPGEPGGFSTSWLSDRTLYVIGGIDIVIKMIFGSDGLVDIFNPNGSYNQSLPWHVNATGGLWLGEADDIEENYESICFQTDNYIWTEGYSHVKYSDGHTSSHEGNMLFFYEEAEARKASSDVNFLLFNDPIKCDDDMFDY